MTTLLLMLHGRSLRVSRGELEITDINNHYLEAGTGFSCANCQNVSIGMMSGQFKVCFQASRMVSLFETRGRVKRLICSPEQIAFENGWIDQHQLAKLAKALSFKRIWKATIRAK